MNARPFDNTRDHLLATGESIMLGKGFAAVGLAEILSAAGVPKGSFYHYFESKEGYGAALLARFFESYLASLDALLANSELNGRAKLEAYFAGWQQHACETHGESRCLVVKLTGEVTDLSDLMRDTLRQGINSIIERLSTCIVLGRADRSIPPGLPADTLAASLYQLWLGAALVAKAQQHGGALDAAQICTTQLLK